MRKISISYPRIYYELLLIGFTLVLGMGLVRGFLPIFASELDPSGHMVGYIVSAWFIVRMFIELPSGYISDRIGRNKLFVWGIVLAAGGSLICAISPSIHFLIAGRALWGFGTALYFLNNIALLFDLFKPKIRGKAVGTFQGIEFAGAFVGAPIGAFLADIFSYHFVFYISFILTSFSCLISLKTKRLEIRKNEGSENLSFKPTLQESLSSLKSWDVLVVCLICFARMFISLGVMSTVFQLYLHDQLGFKLGLIGLIIGARTAGFTIATLLSGYLSDKMGRKPVILAGLLIEIVCLYVYTIVNAFEPILTIGIIDGFGSGMVSSTLIVLLSEIVEQEFRGISIGLYRTFMDLGGILGPIIFMLIMLKVNIRMPFIVGAVILLCMAFLTITIQRKNTHKHKK